MLYNIKCLRYKISYYQEESKKKARRKQERSKKEEREFMLLQTKYASITNGYVKTEQEIDISNERINAINSKIAECVHRNEKLREKGLDIAAKCRMR